MDYSGKVKIMKKTLAAIFAFICVAGGANALTSNNDSFISTSTITAYAATVGTYDNEGLNAANYSYPYADSSVYKTSISTVAVPVEGNSVSSWVDKNNGNTYSIYKVTVTAVANSKDVPITEYRLGLNKFKDAVHDADMTEAITLPDGVASYVKDKYSADIVNAKNATVIGARAFESSYLKTVNLTGVAYIGDYAFAKCQYITEIDIPSSVRYIGTHTFESSGLKTLDVNMELPVVPDYFCSKTNLTELSFAHPEFIRTIGAYAFNSTPLNAPVFNEWNGKDLSNYEIVTVKDNAYEGCTSIKEVNISDNILQLGKNVFKNDTSIQSLKFGRICIGADNSCFYGCSALSSIKFNNILEALGGSCFTGCVSLKTVSGIPTTMKDWVEEDAATGWGCGDGLFSGCTSLTAVILPDSLTRVPASMFAGCKNLTYVKFGKPTDTFGENLTDGASGDNIKKIKKDAFQDCTSLLSISFPNANRIEAEAFLNCTGMKSFKVGECSIVGDRALKNCSSLEDITLLADQYGGDEKNSPDKTYSSYGYVFAECSAAKKITIKGDKKTKLSSGLFSGCSSLEAVGGDISGISIIGKECFNKCSSLKQINLPKLLIIESDGFADCSVLKSISDSGNAIKAEDYGDRAFKNCAELDIEVTGNISTIGASAFQNSAVKKVNINGMVGGTIVIGSNAFDSCKYLESAAILCTGIEKFSVGSGVFSNCPILKTAVYEGPIITSSMFKNCAELTTVETTADTINSSAFENCPKLTMVLERGKATAVIAKQIDSRAFYGCSALKSTSATPNTIFNGTAQYANCASLTGANVSALTTNMFTNCTNLGEVKITNVNVVPNYCFQNCTSLKGFDFSTIDSIGTSGFENTAITELNTTKMDSIGTKGFNNCTKLTKVSAACDIIGDTAFGGCTNLASAALTCEKIGANAFKGDTALKTVTIAAPADSALTTVGNYAFLNCNALTTVTIPGSPTMGTQCVGYVNGKVVSNFVIGGTTGSTVEQYAIKNKLDFKNEKGEIVKNQVTTTTKPVTTTTKKATTTTTAKATTTQPNKYEKPKTLEEYTAAAKISGSEIP